MKVLIGFSDMPAPLGILHNVEEVENKGEKNIINIFFKSKDEAENQFLSHEGFKVHMKSVSNSSLLWMADSLFVSIINTISISLSLKINNITIPYDVL